jgi:nifR3 family TIM-barrel protein
LEEPSAPPTDSAFDLKEILYGQGVLLAPLAGVADSAVRILCRLFGAGPLFSEMVSAHGVALGREYLLADRLTLSRYQTPLTVQLVGREPTMMAEVSRQAVSHGAVSVNLNMACPAPKILKSGKGCALMQEPRLAEQIILAVVKAVKVPVTVKIRAGFDSRSINCVEFARMAQDAGASMVILHPRTRAQMYTGHADWSLIAQTRKAITIPLVGNGDILTPEDAERMLRTTGCDAIMIGRGSYGRPWIFQSVIRHLESKGMLPNPAASFPTMPDPFHREFPGELDAEACERGDRDAVGKVVRMHVMLASRYMPEETMAKEVRKHLAWYSKGMVGATSLRRNLARITDMISMERLGLSFFRSDSHYLEHESLAVPPSRV